MTSPTPPQAKEQSTPSERMNAPVPDVEKHVFNFVNQHPAINLNQDVVRADLARDLGRRLTDMTEKREAASLVALGHMRRAEAATQALELSESALNEQKVAFRSMEDDRNHYEKQLRIEQREHATAIVERDNARQALAEAVEKERERCAKECELFGRNNPEDAAYYAKYIAAAIRGSSEGGGNG